MSASRVRLAQNVNIPFDLLQNERFERVLLNSVGKHPTLLVSESWLSLVKNAVPRVAGWLACCWPASLLCWPAGLLAGIAGWRVGGLAGR